MRCTCDRVDHCRLGSSEPHIRAVHPVALQDVQCRPGEISSRPRILCAQQDVLSRQHRYTYPDALPVSPSGASMGIKASTVRAPNTLAMLPRMLCPPWVDSAFMRAPVPICSTTWGWYRCSHLRVGRVLRIGASRCMLTHLICADETHANANDCICLKQVEQLCEFPLDIA